MTEQNILDFYKSPAEMTIAGEFVGQIGELPGDVESLARIVRGLTILEFMSAAYGVRIPDERRIESHIRRAEEMLRKIFAQNDKPLIEMRAPDERLVGVCRHFAVLLVAFCRAKNIPARARVGYADYLNPGYFENHWVCEYWNENESRWILVDAQLDDVWRKSLKFDFKPTDVPPNHFIAAGEAWTRCRTGRADASKFGIFKGNLRGLWFVAGDVIRDLAALNKQEMLAWDVWGAMPKPDETLDEEWLAFFDSLAFLTADADDSFDEMRRIYDSDKRLHVPEIVFNSILNRPENTFQIAGAS